jgi:hypothetical protein
LAQVCEILLRAGIHSYEKEGTKYLHRFIPETRGKNPSANQAAPAVSSPSTRLPIPLWGVIHTGEGPGPGDSLAISRWIGC